MIEVMNTIAMVFGYITIVILILCAYLLYRIKINQKPNKEYYDMIDFHTYNNEFSENLTFSEYLEKRQKNELKSYK